jgi:hypothetical protein
MTFMGLLEELLVAAAALDALATANAHVAPNTLIALIQDCPLVVTFN